MLKELREILRDRRTIGTLILMPLILYPLLTVGFQQFFLTGMRKAVEPRFHIGFEDATLALDILSRLQRFGGLPLAPDAEDLPIAPNAEDLPKEPDEAGVKPAPAARPETLATGVVGRVIIIKEPFLSDAVQQQHIDAGIRVKVIEQPDPRSTRGRKYQIDLLWNRDSSLSKQALELLQKHFQQANLNTMNFRLARAIRSQHSQVPLQTKVIDLDDLDKSTSRASGTSTSIMAIIPLILIMMTVTGAVYPAIDLTAGERERGTLEILVAAPIPRIGLLFAKYVAVVVVALLTAAVNLVMMAATLFVSSAGQAIFPNGLSIAVIMQVFGLLILFAGFFSAVLLVLTSFARSFKEAQAYLIPLMLVSLAPGALCLKPDLKLTGLWLVTPLVNIVLLGRDLFSGAATGIAVVMVVASTVLYALAAITIAARIFGAESVLYSSPSGWGELFNRPSARRPSATVGGALLTLALLFPAFFLVKNTVLKLATLGAMGMMPWESLPPDFNVLELPADQQLRIIEWQLVLAGIGTVLLFGALPAIVSLWRRIRLEAAFSLRIPPMLTVLGSALLGVSLWMAMHELVLLEARAGLVSFDLNNLPGAKLFASLIPRLPLALVLIAVAAAPAICEEWFFRGFLFSALRRQYSPARAIVISALLFGVFHVVGQGAFTLERMLPSTTMGLVLGWVCWRTGSIFPGMLLHFLHNGFVLTLGHFQDELKARGWNITPAEGELSSVSDAAAHLPATWLAVGAAVAVAGFLLVQLCSGRPAPASPAEAKRS